MKLVEMLKDKRVLIATRNKGKVIELQQLFDHLGLEVASLHDVVGAPEVLEDGETFADNAKKKAQEIAHALNMCVIGDDSGLCVDVLGGRPGVYSARYAGPQASDAENNDKLLGELNKYWSESSQTPAAHESGHLLLSPARFVCVMALVDPVSGIQLEAEGSVEGYITNSPQGKDGFGYDPLFFLPDRGCTMAQLSLEEKNAISHRGQAMRQLIELINEA